MVIVLGRGKDEEPQQAAEDEEPQQAVFSRIIGPTSHEPQVPEEPEEGCCQRGQSFVREGGYLW